MREAVPHRVEQVNPLVVDYSKPDILVIEALRNLLPSCVIDTKQLHVHTSFPKHIFMASIVPSVSS